MKQRDYRSTLARLRRVNPRAFRKVVAAAEAFLAAYDEPNEPAAVFNARLQFIRTDAEVN